jgi:hypothetical protein
MSWALVLIVIMPNDPYYGGTIEKTIMHFTDKKDCEEVAADLATKGSIKLGRIRYNIAAKCVETSAIQLLELQEEEEQKYEQGH